MSMDFYTYTSNFNTTHTLKLEDKRATAAGFQKAAASTKIRATSLGTGWGLHPRYLRLKRTIGTGTTKKSFYSNLPIATQAKWKTYKEGQTVTVNGVQWTVVDTKDESYV